VKGLTEDLNTKRNSSNHLLALLFNHLPMSGAENHFGLVDEE